MHACMYAMIGINALKGGANSILNCAAFGLRKIQLRHRNLPIFANSVSTSEVPSDVNLAHFRPKVIVLFRTL